MIDLFEDTDFLNRGSSNYAESEHASQEFVTKIRQGPVVEVVEAAKRSQSSQ